MRMLLLMAVICGSWSTRLNAEEAHKLWWTYLKGTWTYDIGESKGTATWRPAAKGNALIGRFQGGIGDPSVEVAGWQADRKALVVTGYGVNGNYWNLEYTDVKEQRMAGKIQGIWSDGQHYSADFVAERVDENQWIWVMTGKYESGEPLSARCTLKRRAE